MSIKDPHPQDGLKNVLFRLDVGFLPYPGKVRDIVALFDIDKAPESHAFCRLDRPVPKGLEKRLKDASLDAVLRITDLLDSASIAGI